MHLVQELKFSIQGHNVGLHIILKILHQTKISIIVLPITLRKIHLILSLYALQLAITALKWCILYMLAVHYYKGFLMLRQSCCQR